MRFFIICFLISLGVEGLAVEIQGHRGARSIRPENTLIAFRYVMDHDIPVLEMDLSYTKDRHLVLGHDEKLNRDICLDKNGNRLKKDYFVHKLTLKEIQEFDCGSLVNPRFPTQIPSPKEKMPSFEEVLKVIQEYEKLNNKNFKLNVEIKVHNDYITKNSTEIIQKLIALVKQYGIHERTIIQSFDIKIIEEVRGHDLKIQTAYLIHEDLAKVLKSLKVKDSKELIAKYKFNIMSPNYKLVNKDFVKEFQSQGIEVIPWTVNKPSDWKRMINLKVNGIITDDPIALKHFMK